MRNNHTTGEYAISNAEARVASRTGTPAMDHDAFAGFYQRSAPGLRAYLTRVSGNAALADDLVQESYLRFLCATIARHVDRNSNTRRRPDLILNALSAVGGRT